MGTMTAQMVNAQVVSFTQMMINGAIATAGVTRVRKQADFDPLTLNEQ
jgi:hypothetical protein